MSFDLQLAGMRALVTGGSAGLGAAVVEALVEASARVVTAARSLPNRALDNVHYVAADLSTAEGAHHAAESVHQHLAGIDILSRHRLCRADELPCLLLLASGSSQGQQVTDSIGCGLWLIGLGHGTFFT
jgi:hypothetical protein